MQHKQRYQNLTLQDKPIFLSRWKRQEPYGHTSVASLELALILLMKFRSM